MATHHNIFAWEIPWTEKPGQYSPWGRKGVRRDFATKQQNQLVMVFISQVFMVTIA